MTAMPPAVSPAHTMSALAMGYCSPEMLGWRDANGSRVAGRSFSSDDLEGMQGAMDSFLLYVARSFAMAIGELWTLDGSSMKLTKVYIAPDFYERYSSRIIYPDEDARANPSAQHRYSRELCVRAVLRGEPMWCDLSTPVGSSQSATSAAAEVAAAAPASDESAGLELPLRTAVVIPFNIGQSVGAGTAAVLVLYSSTYRPLPPKQVMHTLSEFTRTVASASSIARFLSTLSSRLETSAVDRGESRSVTDRLGLESSATVPACLHELEQLPQTRCRRATTEPAPTPTIAPDAPLMRQSSGSTFAQRRMRQMLEPQLAEDTA
jgi:hypothetical protein